MNVSRETFINDCLNFYPFRCRQSTMPSAAPHFSALQNKNSFGVVMLKVNDTVHWFIIRLSMLTGKIILKNMVTVQN